MPTKTKKRNSRNAQARSSLARGSALCTDPDGMPYHHDPKKAYAAKLAMAEGDGPVSNETAHAYLAAYPSSHDLAEAFLRWPLPESVCADLCATKQGPGRIGTNLLNYTEAKQMFEQLLANGAGEPRARK